MKFNPGDPVWVKVIPEDASFCYPGRMPEPGEHAAIIVRAHPHRAGVFLIEGPDFDARHTWYAERNRLRPRRDDDANPNALGSWDACPFKPALLRREPDPRARITIRTPEEAKAWLRDLHSLYASGRL